MTYWGAGEQTLGLDVSMLVRDGDGRCGAWAELFETALLIHSVGEIEDVTIVSIYGDSGSNAYMMIKNYSFVSGADKGIRGGGCLWGRSVDKV